MPQTHMDERARHLLQMAGFGHVLIIHSHSEDHRVTSLNGKVLTSFFFFCYKEKQRKKREQKHTQKKTKVYGTKFPSSLKLRDQIIISEGRCEHHTPR